MPPVNALEKKPIYKECQRGETLLTRSQATRKYPVGYVSQKITTKHTSNHKAHKPHNKASTETPQPKTYVKYHD